MIVRRKSTQLPSAESGVDDKRFEICREIVTGIAQRDVPLLRSFFDKDLAEWMTEERIAIRLREMHAFLGVPLVEESTRKGPADDERSLCGGSGFDRGVVGMIKFDDDNLINLVTFVTPSTSTHIL